MHTNLYFLHYVLLCIWIDLNSLLDYVDLDAYYSCYFCSMQFEYSYVDMYSLPLQDCVGLDAYYRTKTFF